ncbi:MAG: hypothetical protein GY928_08270 [Colwellia sp.]|nr:hypothetical protein [Colwellia sp.]
MDNCYHRSTTFLGSTNFDTPYMTLKNYASTNYSINPLTHNWNQAFIRYCDGSSYMSNLRSPMIYNHTALYFRGFPILNAAFTHLQTEYGLSNATDVLIVGGSAGALGVWQFANYIRDTYVSRTANYMSIPDSGFFLEYEGMGQYITGWKWKFDNQNLTEWLQLSQTECMAEYTQNNEDTFQCVFAQNIAKYVKVKTFALQSRVDNWQLTHELCNKENKTVVNGYGYNVTVTFLTEFVDSKPSRHAAYLDSCAHHCGQWDTILIDGYNQSIAARDFYYGNLTHSNLFFQNYSYPMSAIQLRSLTANI